MSYTLGQTLGHNLRHIYESYETLLKYLPEDKSAANFAKSYVNWWMALFHEDPVHVFIETLLLCFISYLIFFKRSQDWKLEQKDHLSEAEKEELIQEWIPAKLCDGDSSPNNSHSNDLSQCAWNSKDVVICKVRGTKLDIEVDSRKIDGVLNFAGHDFLGMGASNERLKEASRKAMKKYGYVALHSDHCYFFKFLYICTFVYLFVHRYYP